MIAIIFFALGAVFTWLLFKGYSTQEIMARGWGTQVRIYRRDAEPIMYWFTFRLYPILVTVCTAVGLLAAFKSIVHHVA
mgnify:FL=1